MKPRKIRVPPRCRRRAPRGKLPRMARYLLHHEHGKDDCGVVYSSFKGHDSPLRRQTTLSSCASGGHAIWWTVDAVSERDALALLPGYVAQRTVAIEVGEVQIP